VFDEWVLDKASIYDSAACLVICYEFTDSAIISEAIHHRSTEDTELLF
jgi:hypothetical protein